MTTEITTEMKMEMTMSDNAASGSGSDGPISDTIVTPRSLEGGSGDDNNIPVAAAPYVFMRWNIDTL